MMCVNVFYTARKEISAGSDKIQSISLHGPIIKTARFVTSCLGPIDMTLQKWAFFIMGVYEGISQFCRI